MHILLPQHALATVAEGVGAAPAQQEAGPGQACAIAARRLRELGYHVLEAADGPAALHLLDGGAQVDMLVTDVGLPNGMNGRQVAEAVRERRPELPLLFITGYASAELPPGAEVIDKPFDLNTLARKVQTSLSRH